VREEAGVFLRMAPKETRLFSITLLSISYHQSLADQVSATQLEKGCLYPPLGDIREVSILVARRVIEVAYREGLASELPEPQDKEELVRKHVYDPSYMSYIPKTYDWPAPAKM
jgi:malic enzyme